MVVVEFIGGGETREDDGTALMTVSVTIAGSVEAVMKAEVALQGEVSVVVT